jgi:Methyltransferase domain
MSKLVAAALVFVCSAAVLMLEILAGRLLAPYVGISLQTYTSIIGTVLAAIAAGAWLGGKLADRFDPRLLVGPTVGLGGILALFIVPIIRALGTASGEGGRGATLLLTFAGFFLPAVVLSAVTPMVVKLQLHDLHRTGGVVGRLSGISTTGALVGTFVTGYLLTETTPTSTTIFALGVTLVVIGLVLGLTFSRRGGAVLAIVAALGIGVATIGASAHGPCQVESAYYCIHLERDPARPSGRILQLNELTHSYVDLTDPTDLVYPYEQAFSTAIAAAFPNHPPLDAVHIGGGGFTLPRYLAAVYPGSKSIVLEIDPTLIKFDREHLGLRTSAALQARVGDARISIRALPDNSADLVVGDAFASLSVPWHLTTIEFLRDVDRVLRPNGIYIMNIIDYPPFRFVRAELATLEKQFRWVGAISPPLTAYSGGNVVLVASDRTLFGGGFEPAVAGDTLLEGIALDDVILGAPVIRDDFAPIDQWLNADKH